MISSISEINTLTPQAEFAAGVRRLEVATETLIPISERAIGVFHTGRQNRALFVFAKLITHCMTMLLIIDKFRSMEKGAATLDHSSLATIARSVIDASLMTMYITFPELTANQWNFRRHVLYLHDLTTRKRFLQSIDSLQRSKGIVKSPAPFFETYSVAKLNLKKKISIYGSSLGYNKSDILELQKGQIVYIDGARGCVREAGWSIDLYEFHQTYFSSFVHSHPVSFIHAETQNISFSDPSNYQIGFCGMVCNSAALYAEAVGLRVSNFTGSESRDPLGQID